MKKRFGQVRKGEKFRFKGKSWTRDHGTFASPEDKPVGHTGWPFKVDDEVEVDDPPVTEAFSPNAEKLLAAVRIGPICAIGSTVYDSSMAVLMNTTDLHRAIRELRMPINRIDSGGSPTWALAETSCAMAVGTGPDVKLGTMPVRAFGKKPPALRKRRRKQPLESPVSKTEYAMGQLTTDVKPFHKAESVPIYQFLAETFGYVSLSFERVDEALDSGEFVEEWEKQSLNVLVKKAENHLNLCAEVLLREDVALGRVQMPEKVKPVFQLVCSEGAVHVFAHNPTAELRTEIASLFPYPELPAQSTVKEAIDKIAKVARP